MRDRTSVSMSRQRPGLPASAAWRCPREQRHRPRRSAARPPLVAPRPTLPCVRPFPVNQDKPRGSPSIHSARTARHPDPSTSGVGGGRSAARSWTRSGSPRAETPSVSVRLVGPHLGPSLLVTYEPTGRESVESLLDLVHERVHDGVEPFIVPQEAVELLLDQLLRDSGVFFTTNSQRCMCLCCMIRRPSDRSWRPPRPRPSLSRRGRYRGVPPARPRIRAPPTPRRRTSGQ